MTVLVDMQSPSVVSQANESLEEIVAAVNRNVVAALRCAWIYVYDLALDSRESQLLAHFVHVNRNATVGRRIRTHLQDLHEEATSTPVRRLSRNSRRCQVHPGLE